MRVKSLSATFMILSALICSQGFEALHSEDPENPHSDRRERQRRMMEQEHEVTTRGNCRVAGRHWYEPV